VDIDVGRIIHRITFATVSGVRSDLERVERNCGSETERDRRWRVHAGMTKYCLEKKKKKKRIETLYFANLQYMGFKI